MNNDLISRSALLEWFQFRLPIDNHNAEVIAGCVNIARGLIANAPAVDAVEVVRCKDCKHWMKDVPGCTDFVGRCELANYMVGATGHCVYGERRADE